MMKTELRGKLVGILLATLIVTSVFSGAVSADNSIVSSNRESDNPVEGNYCNESTAENATITNLNLSGRINELLEEGKWRVSA